MKIRMRVQLSGTRNGRPWPSPGEVAELPPAEATDLLEAGIADKVDDAAVETAAAPEAEVSRPPAAKAPSRRHGRSAMSKE